MATGSEASAGPRDASALFDIASSAALGACLAAGWLGPRVEAQSSSETAPPVALAGYTDGPQDCLTSLQKGLLCDMRAGAEELDPSCKKGVNAATRWAHLMSLHDVADLLFTHDRRAICLFRTRLTARPPWTPLRTASLELCSRRSRLAWRSGFSVARSIFGQPCFSCPPDHRDPTKGSRNEKLHFLVFCLRRLTLKLCYIDPAFRAVNFGSIIIKIVCRKLSYDRFLVGCAFFPIARLRWRWWWRFL